jgi:EmrB/QacA subfamily drug resistance transporter
VPLKLRRLEYKWIVGIVFVFGLFMDLLDMTITNVALPTLSKDFHVGTTTIEWVVTAYLLSLAVFIPVSGWMGDRFGTKKVFLFALAMFTASSFLCGLAWNIQSLIAFRALQGVGGGMLTPVGTAMLFRAFPPAERAAAGALLTIPTVVAPASGPVLGGYLVEFQSWRWIFWINLPVGILGLIVAYLFLREEVQAKPGRFDVPGFVLSGTGLASLLYALSQAGAHSFTDTRVLMFGLGGLTLLGLFAIVELRTPEPMLDVRLLGNKLFRATNMVQLLGFGGLMGALFLLPLLLQSEMGLSPFQSGLTTFPQAFGVVITAQIAGRLYGRIGPRRMLMFGSFGAMLSTLCFLAVQLDTSQWWIRLIMFGRGMGFAFMLVPLQTATYATIRPQDTGRASAIYNAGRQVAASFGVALLATVLSNRLAHHGAQLGDPSTAHGALLSFHEAFVAAAVLAGLGIFLSLLVDDKQAVGTMRQRAGATARSEEPVIAGAD